MSNKVQKVEQVRNVRSTGRADVQFLNGNPEVVAGIYHQDIDGILALNQESRKNSDDNWGRDEDVKFVARIPRTQWIKYQAMGIADDEAALLKAVEIDLDGRMKTTRKRLI